MVKILTVLVSTISNLQVFLLKKCESLLQMQKLLTFFQQKYYVYAIFDDQRFNNMLTNEQLSPDHYVGIIVTTALSSHHFLAAALSSLSASTMYLAPFQKH